ncbi:MAG TPA: SNF2 helicase associated domain-containing protein, partial [Armatimonadota bacterium]
MAHAITAIPLDLLARRVGETLARAGEHLLRHGAVCVVRLGVQSAEVSVSGDGQGATTVVITPSSDDGELHFRFACKCFQTYGKDYRWCAHKYAAALALAHYAEDGTAGNWQGHLTWLLSACAPTRLPKTPPVSIPAQAASPTSVALFSLRRLDGGQVWLVPVSDNPAALTPATPEQQAAMAVLFAHLAARAHRHIPADALYDLLPLLTHVPVYLGTMTHPLKRRLRVMPEQGSLQFHLAENSTGLTITPEIRLADDTTIPVNKDKLYVFSSEMACCLSDDLLFTVPVAAEALKSLLGRPCLEIPADEKACFVHEYLAALARAFPLQGEGLSCQEFHTPPIPRLYLDETMGDLKLRFRFAYGAWDYPRAPLGASPERLEVDVHTSTLYRVTRDFAAEARALEALSALGIIPVTFGARDDFTSEISL